MSLFNLENSPKAKDLREKADKYWKNQRYNMAESGLKRFLGKIAEHASLGDTWVTWLLDGSATTSDSDWDDYLEKLKYHPDELMYFVTILKYELEQLGYHVWRIAHKSSGDFAGLLVSWEKKKKFPKNKYAKYF